MELNQKNGFYYESQGLLPLEIVASITSVCTHMDLQFYFFLNFPLDLLLLWHPISVSFLNIISCCVNKYCFLFFFSVDVVICMLQSVPITSKLNISLYSLCLNE